ncbi:TSC22 domain family protein 1 isoform A [Alligator mississippiensis]|uniref:TSC22 domain family protein 1 n=1 Tax=Alligator mississippiensis TaxID=8496 RepID=A0A151MHN2_ALLMI|nr:TSC22 domain family protein 1 isoform A [Alligator mississippiensis]
MKKKSGFQITSVTPAQISASISSNNSIAEDTESYDDLDESHTEDLSSSEILDVSLSRATDLGEPERSSSEETLNNFQEAETPGAVSPNQPHLSQQHPPLPHPAQQSVVINGSVHPHHVHHHHPLHHHGHHHPSAPGVGSTPASGGPPPSPSFRKLSTTGSSDNVITTAPVSAASSTGSPASVMSSIRTTSTPGNIGVSPVTGTSTLSNMGGGSSGVTSGMAGTVNLNNITSTGNVNALSGTGSSVNVNILSGIGNGTSASSNVINNVTNPTAGLGSSQQQPAAGTSRFRVVKLDSSSEPFKKGRWTCTEFYDKDNTVAVTEGVAVNKAVETIKQNPLEVTSERESTSGSSVSSSVSTLSHYTESVGSGEMGAPTVVQQQAFQGVGPQQMDFSSAGPQPIPASSIPQSVSQSQLAQVQLHAQEVNYSQQKQGVQPPVSASLTTVTGVQSTPVNIVGVSSALGHQQPAMQSMAQQQLPYSQPAQPVQTLPVVQQQQLQYGQQQQQQQAVPTQMAPGLVKQVSQNSVTGTMPDYMQHQQILQTSAPAMQSGTTAVGTGTPVPVAQAPSMQPSVQAHPAVTPAQPVAHAQTAMPAVLPLTTHLVDGEDESSSGASVVAIDNKIEQAMDLVKSHLMYAVREEVEVLKEQIKELIEKNSQLEQENTLLKTLASPEQLAQFQAQLQTGSRMVVSWEQDTLDYANLAKNTASLAAWICPELEKLKLVISQEPIGCFVSDNWTIQSTLHTSEGSKKNP